ncbi:MAG: phosphatase PAP2 family protein [Jatrophihabitans sp.]
MTNSDQDDDPAPAELAAEAGSEERERRWSRIRKLAGIGYVVLLVAVIATIGIPTDRGSLLLIILFGLAIPCLGRGWRSFRQVLYDWLPFTAVLVAYDYSRGIADALGMPLHVSDVAAIDHAVFGVNPTNWLQDRFLTPGSPHWYDAVATIVYTSHFLATPITAAILWVRNRAIWVRFVRRVIALALAGLVTYVLYPAAPPWYAAQEGVIGPVIRASGRGWFWLHINHAGNLLQEGQVASNPVAAMPSLHTAYSSIITLFLLASIKGQWRWLLVGYPILMGISLVYMGEHYVIDVVAGVVYAFVLHNLCNAWERRHPPEEKSARPWSQAPVSAEARPAH